MFRAGEFFHARKAALLIVVVICCNFGIVEDLLARRGAA